MSGQPFDGVKVLDFSAVLSGPLATAMLSDQGADVIKVEPPEGDLSRRIGPVKNAMSAMFITANRGKRSLAVDLKSADGKALVSQLAARADVLVENFRPGAMKRLGLDYDTLAATNPRLVYLTITGYGPDGPYADGRVYDGVIQALSGISAAHRDAATGGPTLLTSAICDKLTALTAAQAISAALFQRERTGRGQHVSLSMLDAALAFNWCDVMYNHVFVDEPPPPWPEYATGQKPWQTRDGFVMTMTPQADEFAAMCRGFGRPELADDPRFATPTARSRHIGVLRELLEPEAARQDTAECVARLRAAGTPIGRVNERTEVLVDPQVVHNNALAQIDHGSTGRVRLARSAARFHKRQGPDPRPAPQVGENTVQVLKELGLTDDAIAQLLEKAVIHLKPRDG